MDMSEVERWQEYVHIRDERIAELEAENERLRAVLQDTLTVMGHAKKFIGADITMHKDGRILYANAMLDVERALDQ